jgi:hypothetical protein
VPKACVSRSRYDIIVACDARRAGRDTSRFVVYALDANILFGLARLGWPSFILINDCTLMRLELNSVGLRRTLRLPRYANPVLGTGVIGHFPDSHCIVL